MNHSLIHKFLGLAILAGVFLALTSNSEAVERTRSHSGNYTSCTVETTKPDSTTGTHTQSFTTTKEPAPTP